MQAGDHCLSRTRIPIFVESRDLLSLGKVRSEENRLVHVSHKVYADRSLLRDNYSVGPTELLLETHLRVGLQLWKKLLGYGHTVT